MVIFVAGLTGVTLYFGLEPRALTYTSASNVGIIVSVSPFFTAIFSKIFLKENNINKFFVSGFVFALSGIILISTQGDFNFEMNVLGDILAVLSVICWAIYSLISKKISNLGYHNISVIHRIFFYGLLFMLPIIFFSDFNWSFEYFAISINFINILYLGLSASALCFYIWKIKQNAANRTKSRGSSCRLFRNVYS